MFSFSISLSSMLNKNETTTPSTNGNILWLMSSHLFLLCIVLFTYNEQCDNHDIFTFSTIPCIRENVAFFLVIFVPFSTVPFRRGAHLKNFGYSFSYDTRGTNAKTPSHWRDEDILGNRAVFRAGREPAELIINPVLVIISFITIMNINWS